MYICTYELSPPWVKTEREAHSIRNHFHKYVPAQDASV